MLINNFLEAKEMKNTKKAVILKLLLVYLKATLRKLHNSLLASYGLTHLFDLFWHSLNIHFVQRAFISCPAGKTTRGLCSNRAKLKLSYYVLVLFYSSIPIIIL